MQSAESAAFENFRLSQAVRWCYQQKQTHLTKRGQSQLCWNGSRVETAVLHASKSWPLTNNVTKQQGCQGVSSNIVLDECRTWRFRNAIACVAGCRLGNTYQRMEVIRAEQYELSSRRRTAVAVKEVMNAAQHLQQRKIQITTEMTSPLRRCSQNREDHGVTLKYLPAVVPLMKTARQRNAHEKGENFLLKPKNEEQ